MTDRVRVSLPDGAAIVNGQQAFVFDGWAYKVQQCRYCGANIAFVPHPDSGRYQPRDAGGTVHFATCPNYKQPKKPKKVSPQMRLF